MNVSMPSGTLAGLPESLAGLSAFRRSVLSFLLGVLATLALPPVGAWPVLWLALPPLVWITRSGKGAGKGGFLAGYLFAFGYFTAGWYWISNALLVFSDDFWWMVPFAAIGLPAAMAVYYGVAGALAARLSGGVVSRTLAFVLVFALADLARGHLMTGFPWNLFGYAWADDAWLSQSAALIGTYGIGVAVLVSAFLPALLAAPALQSRRMVVLCLLTAAAIPVSVAAWGAYRLANAPPAAEDRIGLRLVQGGIPQREKWARRYAERNFRLHVDLSTQDRPEWVDVVVWPETAAAFFIEDHQPALDQVSEVVPDGGYLITGAPRRRGEPAFTLHNGAVVIDQHGTVVASYDKAHLVPFGEYVPLKGLLPVEKVAAGATDYTPGPGPRTIDVPRMPPVSLLICYETIFPGAVVSRTQDRPEWLLNLTNDAWYGETAGPYQHLQHTRMRAIEEGLAMIRAANTGISAGFDPFGRELGRLGLNESGYLDLRLPSALEPTPYARYRDWPLGIALALLAFLFVLCRKSRV